jgi:predicted nucleic acid-binding protein
VFVPEEGSDRAREVLATVRPGGTSRISIVECRAAFARAARNGRLSRRSFSAALASFDEMRTDLLLVEFDSAVERRAATIIRERALRSIDAIHLASALTLAESEAERIMFASWDVRLWDAASDLGFAMAPSPRPN